MHRLRVVVINGAPAVCFAAVPGATTAGTCVPPTATTTTAFLLPELMDLPDGKCLTRPSSCPRAILHGKKQVEPGMLVEFRADA